MNLPVDFEQKVKLPPAVNGRSYPYQISARDLMQDFRYAALQVDETEARRRRCSNCEYYDNRTLAQAKMDKIPWNAWDDDAGFRGYCHKFEFICHDLRSCQAWQEREFEFDD
jgi:hypothetical protein